MYEGIKSVHMQNIHVNLKHNAASNTITKSHIKFAKKSYTVYWRLCVLANVSEHTFCPAEDWDMLDVDDAEHLTGEEEFELLSAPLGLSERRPVPEAVHFPDTDPLGASVAMVTATNSMEETLLQIGTIITPM